MVNGSFLKPYSDTCKKKVVKRHKLLCCRITIEPIESMSNKPPSGHIIAYIQVGDIKCTSGKTTRGQKNAKSKNERLVTIN